MSAREWRLWVASPFRQWWGAYPPRTQLFLPPRPLATREGQAEADEADQAAMEIWSELYADLREQIVTLEAKVEARRGHC